MLNEIVPCELRRVVNTLPIGLGDCYMRHVEQDLARRVVAGWSSPGSPLLLYCPGNPNTRDQMAVFLTKTFNLQ